MTASPSSKRARHSTDPRISPPPPPPPPPTSSSPPSPSSSRDADADVHVPAPRPVRADRLLRTCIIPSSSSHSRADSSETVTLSPPFHYTCGSPTLSSLLSLTSRQVCELVGSSLSGKTALATDFALHVLQNEGIVIWFETTHSIWQVTNRFPSVFHPCLAVFAVPTYTRALDALRRVAHALRRTEVIGNVLPNRNRKKTVLVVFDSIANIASPLLGLRLPPAWSGHVALDTLAAMLRNIAMQGRGGTGMEVTVVVTNRVVHDSNGNNVQAALGNKWATFVDGSVFLRRRDDENISKEKKESNNSNDGGYAERHNDNNNGAGTDTGAERLVLDVSIRTKRRAGARCQVAVTPTGISDV